MSDADSIEWWGENDTAATTTDIVFYNPVSNSPSSFWSDCWSFDPWIMMLPTPRNKSKWLQKQIDYRKPKNIKRPRIQRSCAGTRRCHKISGLK